MRAIILDEPGHLRQINLSEPEFPAAGEALVRVHRVGICGTDLHAYQGNQPFFSYPRIPGHELGVEVLAVGEGVSITPGTRCSVEPYFACGTCPACLRGKPNCCLRIQVFGVHCDGGMRELVKVPARYLHPAPALTFDQLALVEPLAIGVHAVARAQLIPDERVLVIGAGPIGLAVVEFAVLAGVRVSVLDISEQRLAFCQRHWPQITCLNGLGDTPALLQEVYGEDLPTAVFDATGSPRSMQAAFNYVGHGARLIFVGLFIGDVTFHDPDFHRRELTLISSRNATSAEFTRIIADLEARRINLAPWITHRTNIDNLIDDFPGWFDRESGIIKAVVAFT